MVAPLIMTKRPEYHDCYAKLHSVKDIETSKRFYEKLGFTVFAGDQSQNWLMMKNGGHAIGLFQVMFEKNILT